MASNATEITQEFKRTRSMSYVTDYIDRAPFTAETAEAGDYALVVCSDYSASIWDGRTEKARTLRKKAERDAAYRVVKIANGTGGVIAIADSVTVSDAMEMLSRGEPDWAEDIITGWAVRAAEKAKTEESETMETTEITTHDTEDAASAAMATVQTDAEADAQADADCMVVDCEDTAADGLVCDDHSDDEDYTEWRESENQADADAEEDECAEDGCGGEGADPAEAQTCDFHAYPVRDEDDDEAESWPADGSESDDDETPAEDVSDCAGITMDGNECPNTVPTDGDDFLCSDCLGGAEIHPDVDGYDDEEDDDEDEDVDDGDGCELDEDHPLFGKPHGGMVCLMECGYSSDGKPATLSRHLRTKCGVERDEGDTLEDFIDANFLETECQHEAPEPAKAEPKAKRERKPKTKKQCMCGCGELCGNRFRPGHDARLKGLLQRVSAAQDNDEIGEGIPAIAVERAIQEDVGVAQFSAADIIAMMEKQTA